MSRLISTITIISLTITLSACGFHMRSSKQLPAQMSTTYLKAKDPYLPFVITIKQMLTSAGIILAANQAEAPVTLNLLNVNFQYYSPTLGSSSLARTYNFYGSVTYELTDKNGKLLLKPQIIISSNSLTLNANQLLDNNNQAKQLKQEMIQDMANQLFNRLSSEQTHLALNPPKPTTHKINVTVHSSSSRGLTAGSILNKSRSVPHGFRPSPE